MTFKKEKIKVERSAGAIVFRRSQGNVYYLLLQHARGHWAFPKGHIESGERSHEAAHREIEEETGIRKVRMHPKYKETIKFHFQWPPKSKNAEHRLKFVVFFLGEVFTSRIKLSHEHKAYKWVDYSNAMRMLKHKNIRELLSKAHARVSRTK